MEFGRDGALWFPESVGISIVRFDTENERMEIYPSPSTSAFRTT
jgi:streptogramin lyase